MNGFMDTSKNELSWASAYPRQILETNLRNSTMMIKGALIGAGKTATTKEENPDMVSTAY